MQQLILPLYTVDMPCGPANRAENHTDQAANPNSRIAKAEDRIAVVLGNIAIRRIVHGALDKRPLVPRRIERMIHAQPWRAVVIVHILLHLQYLFNKFAEGQLAIARHLRNIAQQIHHHRHDHKEQYAPKAEPNQSRQRFFAALLQCCPLLLA